MGFCGVDELEENLEKELLLKISRKFGDESEIFNLREDLNFS